MNQGKKTGKAHRYVPIAIFVSILPLIILYLAGQHPSIELHQHAVGHLGRSIIAGWTVVLLLAGTARVLPGKKVVDVADENNSARRRDSIVKTASPGQAISIIFALITIANSLMMITGLDTPKNGVFAYVHLLVRLSIVSLFVIVFSFSEIISNVRKTRFSIDPVKFLYLKPDSPSLIVVSGAFTRGTAALCLLSIAFQRQLSPAGGEKLYAGLLVFWLGLWVINRLIRLPKKRGGNE